MFLESIIFLSFIFIANLQCIDTYPLRPHQFIFKHTTGFKKNFHLYSQKNVEDLNSDQIDQQEYGYYQMVWSLNAEIFQFFYPNTKQYFSTNTLIPHSEKNTISEVKKILEELKKEHRFNEKRHQKKDFCFSFIEELQDSKPNYYTLSCLCFFSDPSFVKLFLNSFSKDDWKELSGYYTLTDYQSIIAAKSQISYQKLLSSQTLKIATNFHLEADKDEDYFINSIVNLSRSNLKLISQNFSYLFVENNAIRKNTYITIAKELTSKWENHTLDPRPN